MEDMNQSENHVARRFMSESRVDDPDLDAFISGVETGEYGNAPALGLGALTLSEASAGVILDLVTFLNG